MYNNLTRSIRNIIRIGIFLQAHFFDTSVRRPLWILQTARSSHPLQFTNMGVILALAQNMTDATTAA